MKEGRRKSGGNIGRNKSEMKESKRRKEQCNKIKDNECKTNL